MLTLGTGVGGGIVLEGRIWHGMTGMAGEFGHMTVEPEGPPVRLRQPGLRGTICFGHGSGSNGEGGDCLRPRARTGESRQHQIRSSTPRRFTTWRFRETKRPRKSSAEWDALWEFALRTWSTRSISICMWSAEECRAPGRHSRHSSLKNCGSALWFMLPPLPFAAVGWAGCFGAGGSEGLDQDDRHSGVAGQRRRTVWRGRNCHGEK